MRRWHTGRRRTAAAVALGWALSPALAGTSASAVAAVPLTLPLTPPGATAVGGPRLGLAGVQVDLPVGVPAPPVFACGSYVLADLDTGAVIAARGSHWRALPASTLKTLTVLTTLPHVDPPQMVVADPTDVAVDGTKVGLDPGSRYTVDQLLHGTVLASGNDTATALARVAGGVPQTVARMQALATNLGALDTTVRNPSGLDAPGQLTSAYDLALIARAAMARPDFRRLAAARRIRFPGKEIPGKRRETYQIQNHNKLIYNYPGAIGVKNGYTVAARWTVIGAATRGGHTYVLTALRRTDGSWRPEAAMLDWAFAHGQQARPVGRLVHPGELAAAPTATPVPSGSTGETGAVGAATATNSVQPAVGTQGRTPSAAATAGRPGIKQVVVGVGLAAAALVLLVGVLSARARRHRGRRPRGRRPAQSAGRASRPGG